MEFEVKNALRDLDQKTLPYLVGELFCHGSLDMRRTAIEALTELDPERRSVRIAREVLKLV